MSEHGLSRPAAGGDELPAVAENLRGLAVRSLRRMYRADQRVFAFRLRRQAGADLLEGVSRRYTAIVLIGLGGETPETAQAIIGPHTAAEVLERLTGDCERSCELGEVALAAWAAAAHDHAGAERLIERLRQLRPDREAHDIVPVAWALSALALAGGDAGSQELAAAIAERLLRSMHPRSGLFPHRPAGAPAPAWRAHVACFADQVYPVQALSYYHRATGSREAAEAALGAAARLGQLQGREGQWWWHYDVRTGRVLERYPVYAIHQDAMGPMALFDAGECCGENYLPAIRRSMSWLFSPPEIPGSLVDTEADVVWRKVARREPRKMVRKLQASLSRLHPACRVPCADALFPPTAIDYETRPYHMGWLLYAWSRGRLADLAADRAGPMAPDAHRPASVYPRTTTRPVSAA